MDKTAFFKLGGSLVAASAVEGRVRVSVLAALSIKHLTTFDGRDVGLEAAIV